VSDETTHPDIDPQDDDFEAHGLKEGIAVALGAGALAVSGAGVAQGYVAPVDDGGRVSTTAPAKPLAKKTTKKKAAKKKAAKSIAVSGGKTSPKKPLLEPDA